MEIFSIHTRATVEISVDDFGTDRDKAVYYEWARENPQVRVKHDVPADDGKGPMPDLLRETIIECLRRRYDHLGRLSRSPLITPADKTEIAVRMSHLHGVAGWLHPGTLEWPSTF